MTKKHLLFLHGALGSNRQWERFIPYFKDQYILHLINFPGHGNSPVKSNNCSLISLTEYIKAYLLKNNILNFSIIGYSMGGYVGLNLIKEEINGYESLITLATKLNWNSEISNYETNKLTLENLNPIYEKLQLEHGTNFASLIDNTKHILTSIGYKPINKNQFSLNQVHTTMLLGSHDKMITEDEITSFIDNIPFFKFEQLKNQPHNLERMDEELISSTILRLLKETD